MCLCNLAVYIIMAPDFRNSHVTVPHGLGRDEVGVPSRLGQPCAGLGEVLRLEGVDAHQGVQSLPGSAKLGCSKGNLT